MNKIKQAVIFCGGMGTRLGHLTKNKPKPMIHVSGKPFLEHLIIQLKKNGIKKILLLTGFQELKIRKYFQNGSKWNVSIKYSYNPPETKTALRLLFAKKLLDDYFLLLYSDNYCSLNLSKHISIYKEIKKPILITVCKKKIGNCNFLKNNRAISYSTKRSNKKKYVEVGYMILKKNVLKNIKKINVDFSYYLELFAKDKKLFGFLNHGGYLSIGDPDRLKLTRSFFKRSNYILIDRDGVLNKRPPVGKYVAKVQKLRMLDRFVNKLKYGVKNLKFICISNQAGIATGELKNIDLNKINNKIKQYFKSKINIVDFFVSKDHFNSNSFYRKPNPGLFFEAAKKYKFILDKTIYIGDDKRDVEAAYNANTYIKYIGKEIFTKLENKKYRNILIKSDINNFIKKKLKNEF